jgi:hypothetical protein
LPAFVIGGYCDHGHSYWSEVIPHCGSEKKIVDLKYIYSSYTSYRGKDFFKMPL